MLLLRLLALLRLPFILQYRHCISGAFSADMWNCLTSWASRSQISRSKFSLAPTRQSSRRDRPAAVQTESIGASSSAGTSAKPGYHLAAKSAFVSLVRGSYTAGISLLSLSCCCIQAAVIAGYIWNAVVAVRQKRICGSDYLEVIHLNRTALTGALSASVAHELNQPLGAIQSYAEAASLYLKADPPNLGTIEEILENIRRDDKRAADIISHLRGLLKKPIERNGRSSISTTRCETHSAWCVRRPRNVVFSSTRIKSMHRCRFAAIPIHVQQVILNLAMNGMDAMQANTPGRGRMSIETTLSDGNAIQVLVTDSGIGHTSRQNQRNL